MDIDRIHRQPATLYPRHSDCFKGETLSQDYYEGFCEGCYSVHPRTTRLMFFMTPVYPFFRSGTAVRTTVLTNSGLYPRTILDESRI